MQFTDKPIPKSKPVHELESSPSTYASHNIANNPDKITKADSPSSYICNVMQDANNHNDNETEEPNSYWINRNYNQRIPLYRAYQQNYRPSKFNNQLKHNNSSTTPKECII